MVVTVLRKGVILVTGGSDGYDREVKSCGFGGDEVVDWVGWWW